MRYENQNLFKEDHRIAIDGVARVVCFICGVDYNDIIGRSRKRIYVDARRLICKYVYDNIPPYNNWSRKNIALSSWFFGYDHSTILYAVQSAEDLYKTDANFARLYDALIEIIDNPSYSPDFTYAELYCNSKTWDEVRMDTKESNRVRYELVPQQVKDDINSLYKKGYSEYTISEKVGTTLEFVSYFVHKERITRDKTSNIKRVMSLRKAEFNRTFAKVDY